ncbi:MAG: hypothetical protein ABH952_08540 [Candidatus Omnitrophota bacterium]
MMETEKKYFGSWWVWVTFLTIITVIIFTGLSYFGIIGKTIVERKVFERSYQKRAADEDALSTYDAQIAVLQRRLRARDITEDERSEIQAQIDSITILKSSKRN